MNNRNFDSSDEKIYEDNEIKDTTFIVKLKYHQNHSLQGTIQWIEKGKVVHFRSMMELFLLLNESTGNKEIRSWEDENGILTIVRK